MTGNKFSNFIKRHPIISAIISILIVDILLLVIASFGLGWFTNHNQYQIVPELKGMNVAEAAAKLRQSNLVLEISDSIFEASTSPGNIIIQTPKAGSKIKNNRTIYVTIRSFSTQQVSIPSIVDLSLRQGMSMLQAAGFKNIVVEKIPSEYSDLIYDLKMNGLSLSPGDKVPVNANLTIVVGDGLLFQADSVILDNYNEAVIEGSVTDEYSEYEY
ncbi:MAG: PASTA domain-containing protein [Bacteroidetes bacterium]|uniref:PASTA domain-containing protein n=1 Tax=Candidatus Limisoma faecipullorum TaxID=2840854 RepID=A0A9D9NKD9_9BACT|nr:PASTA domain-containing protein [Candidatus Limisoma faecipullorum]